MPAMMRRPALAALAALLVACAQAPVQQAAPRPLPEAEIPAAMEPTVPLAQLEEIFWTCDYVATTSGMDATPIRQCAAATRELRRVKFDGSFQRMLAWWRENKMAEHGRIRAARNDPQL